MNDYVKYCITGFEGFNLCYSCFHIIDDGIIKGVEIDNELSCLKIILEDDILIDNNANHIKSFVNEFLLRLVFNSSINKSKPEITVTERYSAQDTHANLQLNSTIAWHVEIDFLVKQRNDVFLSKMFGDNLIPISSTHELIYKRILIILQVDNTLMQFLSLYELLKDIVSQNIKPKQKNVVDFIRRLTSDEYNYITFHPTRLSGYDFEEDCFTYTRNQLSHAEMCDDLEVYNQVCEKVNASFVSKLLVILNQALLAADE